MANLAIRADCRARVMQDDTAHLSVKSVRPDDVDLYAYTVVVVGRERCHLVKGRAVDLAGTTVLNHLVGARISPANRNRGLLHRTVIGGYPVIVGKPQVVCEIIAVVVRVGVISDSRPGTRSPGLRIS